MFESLRPSSREIKPDASYLAYQEARIKVDQTKEADVWMVVIDATIYARGKAATEPLVLNLGYCPLVLRTVVSDRIHSAEYVVNSHGVPAVLLTGANFPHATWHEARLRLTFHWMPTVSIAGGSVGGRGQGTLAPCLVLPEMLPRLVSVGDPFALPHRELTRVFFDDQLPPGLNAGGIAVPDAAGDPSPELLQTVIFRRTEQSRSSDQVAVAFAGAASASPTALAAAKGRLVSMAEFIAEELNCAVPVRFVACIDERSHPELYAPSGAYCSLSPLAVGLTDPRVGQDLSVIRCLSQGWLSGGVRLWGENAVTLTLAIAGALGLRWFEANDRMDHLAEELERQEAVVAEARESRDWSEGNMVLDTQLAMFRRNRSKKVMIKVGAIIRERWGQVVPQGVIVDALRSAGVSVPHVFE